MFANVRQICREHRNTPSRLEKPAGRLHRPPKSPIRVTSAQRCYGTWRAGGDRRVRRDDSLLEIIVGGGPKKTQAWGADEAGKLIAEADAVAASIPSMTGTPARRAAASQFLKLWRQVLQQPGQRPGSWRVAAEPGGWGRYEARKSDLQSSDLPASRYSSACRLVARQAGV